jgi:hypothetical protein
VQNILETNMKTNNDEDDGDEMMACASPGCACQVEPGQTYCSELCQNQQKDGPCHCGHFVCREAQENM